MSNQTQVWWAHTRWALLLFTLLAGALASTQWDLLIAHHLYFDAATGQWRGTHNFWANTVLHNGGRWTIRVILLSMAIFWAVTLRSRQLAEWRRPAGYAWLAMALCIVLTGVLKLVTNVHCPWDLREFGGHAAYLELFAARPAGPAAHCFPAAHASSGYALVVWYFALRERYPALAKWGALAALLTGVTFGVAQQMRGAHFLSHDVWSAFLTWMTATSVYAFGFRARLWPVASATRHEEAAQQFAARLGQHAA